MRTLIVQHSRKRFTGLILIGICAALCSESSAQAANATPTTETPVAIKLLEIGKASSRTFSAKLEKLLRTYDPSAQLYIINYGSDSEIKRREKLITSTPFRWPEDHSRVTLVRGGPYKGPKTVFWKIPPGADSPAP